jgi:hypothetical protein
MSMCLQMFEGEWKMQLEIEERGPDTDHSWDILLRSIGKVKQLSLYIQQAPELHLEVHSLDGGRLKG